MLMASGFQRYFQIAKCFRDEDLRADRQPEFTQIDLEMAFSNSKDVQRVIHGLCLAIWNVVGHDLSKKYPHQFPRLSFHDALNKVVSLSRFFFMNVDL